MKKFIFNILCNTLTGKAIKWAFKNRIPNLRYKGFRFSIAEQSEKRLAAAIFFGFYESAEIRFLEKYFLGDMDVIELGASSGVLSSHILKKMIGKNKRLISVEANSLLRTTWEYNVSQVKSSSSSFLINSALFYGADVVSFSVSNNSTESRVTTDSVLSVSQVTVSAISLSKLIQTYLLKEYTLFCDIEGAESQIFLEESQEVLTKCKHLFIELHATHYKNKSLSVQDLHELVQSKGFDLVEKHGPVCYYRSSNFN